MKFLELNKKRHATKHFTDKPVDPKDVRTAIEIATLPNALVRLPELVVLTISQKNNFNTS